MPLYELPNGRRRWTYIVYVVELDPDACAEHGSPCSAGRCGKTPVYVGQTALTAEERLANHRRGQRANTLVKQHARRLAVGLAPEVEYSTRPEAEAVEAEVAERLRREGYCVSGGH
jgi:predicted GIY-YIG superfamily endonuclease